MKYRHRARGRPTNVSCAILGYDQGLYVWFQGPRRRNGLRTDREGLCHGSLKDRGNKYTANDGLGVFAESTKTGSSRNTLKRGESKDDRLKVAIPLLGALGTYIHGTQRK